MMNEEFTIPIVSPSPLTSESTNEPRYCVNCQYVATAGSGDWTKFRCMATQNDDGVNWVTGTRTFRIEFCKDARQDLSPRIDGKTIYIESCGKVGHWWKEKETRSQPTNENSFDKITKGIHSFGSQAQDLDGFTKEQLEENKKKAAERVAAIRNKKNEKKVSDSDLENL